MYVQSEQASGKCDRCSERPATVGALCKGRTGRVCEVLWVCTQCTGKTDIRSAEYARTNIKRLFGDDAYADF